jgi:hypothetical protein
MICTFSVLLFAHAFPHAHQWQVLKIPLRFQIRTSGEHKRSREGRHAAMTLRAHANSGM